MTSVKLKTDNFGDFSSQLFTVQLDWDSTLGSNHILADMYICILFSF